MRLYLRKGTWWVQHQGKRISTRHTDELAAKLWAMTYERNQEVLRLLEHDAELAEQALAVLKARKDARQHGMIYGISDGDLVKVGFTGREPILRLRQVQTHLGQKVRLVALVKGTRADERDLHRAFAAERVHGEWFRGPLVDAWVQQNRRTETVQGHQNEVENAQNHAAE